MTHHFSLGGKILKVDLTRQVITTEPSAQYAERFLGGLGVNLFYLLNQMQPGVDALEPESVLAFGAGTLVGTLAPTACRVVVNSKNMFSGGLGSASAGGFFSAELKYAGYDNVIITGQAEKPVFLRIADDRVTIEDASHLWGRTTWETEDLLTRQLGRSEMVSIGPAGENRVGAACVIASHSRSASRCGLGAVMGAKNLKAIAVNGTGTIQVADPEGFMAACWEAHQKILASKTTQKLLEYGTPASFIKWNQQAALPTRNFQFTQMDLTMAENLNADNFKQHHIKKPFGCFACPMFCSQYLVIKDGPYAGTRGEKIECQNLWDFGTKLGMDNLEGVIKASQICTQLGLDINNASGALSWAFECFQRDILTTKDTDGLELKWGDTASINTLLHKMAYKEGFGALLAEGSKRASEIIGRGSQQYAVITKGQELAEELRAFKGWALGVTVAERGCGHTTGAPLSERMDISPELSQKLFGVKTASVPETYEGKAELVVYFQQLHAVLEALGICHFSSNWMGPHMLTPDDYVNLYNLATGHKHTADELMAAGERLHNMSRLYNVRHAGLSRQDDYPPDRMINEKSTGTNSGQYLDRQKWDTLLDEYYDLHGWDRATGHPRQETLKTLELDDLVDY
jgi:aldehyde:ferredoxin oxidoreductase